MSEQNVVDQISADLISTYPTTGEGAAERLGAWASGSIPLLDTDVLLEFLAGAPLDLVHENFWRDIPFGTGGVRGPVGIGPNRMNASVVALTIQAHCDYLSTHAERLAEAGKDQLIVLANDVREFHDHNGLYKFLTDNPLLSVGSRSLALLAAEVYAANGFTVYLMEPGNDEAILTTPELSFLIRHFNAQGGVNMSASHNPPDDNGVKVYDENGGQYLPPYDEELTDLARTVTEIRRTDFAAAVADGRIQNIPAEGLAAYRVRYDQIAQRDGLTSDGSTPIVYSPLCGCGARTLGDELIRLGYPVQTPPGQDRDPAFSAIPLLAPNPEVVEATAPGREFADSIGSTIMISSDPDADRLGAEVKHDGAWVHLTGNQISTILSYFLLMDDDGPHLKGSVITTIVSTRAVPAIARAAGVPHVVNDLLIGFKYIGNAINAYDETLPADRSIEDVLAFATEESHGFQLTADLRDKDSLSGGVHLARLHERLVAQGRTLVDYLGHIYATVGQFGDLGRSLVIVGAQGVAQIREVMEKLRTETPTSIGGLAVLSSTDRWQVNPANDTAVGPQTSNTEREARNLMMFSLDGGLDGQIDVEVRPSGTEPKLKFYVHAAGDGAQATAARIADVIYTELARLAGVDLEPVYAGLPDVLSLNTKAAIQNEIAPEAAGHSGDDFDGWLKDRLAGLVPGSDPVSVVRPTLRAAGVL
ncbi:phospho-sugar mutase [soil metagenome]